MVLNTFIYVIHIIVCVCIIGLVLVQHGKGADAGAAFGSGASGTVFGAAGKSNFLARTTKWFVILFFVTSLFMMLSSNQGRVQTSLIEQAIVNEVPDSLSATIDDQNGAVEEVPSQVVVPPVAEEQDKSSDTVVP